MGVNITFKAIIPPKINPDTWKMTMLKALDREIQIDKRMLQKTVTTWSSPKPVFKTEAKVSTTEGATARAWTDSDKWNWVDQGTESHPIPVRNAPYLVFRWGPGRRPKTKVRTLGSGRGAQGRNWAKRKIVQHPGIKAREFSQEVIERRRHYFYRDMLKANTDGVIKACKG